jgi:DNA transposition AAA+ family ATPase
MWRRRALATRIRPAANRTREHQRQAGLAAGDDRGPRTVILTGLGGAGKTTVAVEYAHRHLADVAVAWQFSAGDPAVLAGQVRGPGGGTGRA